MADINTTKNQIQYGLKNSILTIGKFKASVEYHKNCKI
jgi:hypothetical protein